MYDNQIGRWMVLDPFADKYLGITPYSYCLNNPIVFVDPDGRDVILYDKKFQKVATITKEGTLIEKGMENSSILKAYNETKKYLKNDPIFAKMEKTEGVLNIMEAMDMSTGAIFTPGSFLINGVDRFEYKGDAEGVESADYVNKDDLGTISWNTLAGAVDGEGNRHSPAMIFFHELSHAENYASNLLEFVKRTLTPLPKLTTKEEEKVIDKSNEKSKELKNGDGGDGEKKKRTSHKVQYFFKTKSTTSNEE